MKERLLSLDVLRGMTVMGMILVNNPGDWGNIYAPLRHAEWAGLTPTDLVFPFFMFLMGVSMAFSLPRLQTMSLGEKAWKIGRRSVLLILIGMGLVWFDHVLWNLRALAGGDGMSLCDALLPWHSQRIPGVLQRFGLTYGLTSVLILLCPRRRPLAWTALGLLAVYQVVLLRGNGFELSHDNIIYQVDAALFGESHLYAEWVDGARFVFDPEGLVSTLPCISHVIIGYLVGNTLRRREALEPRLLQLAVGGTLLLVAGWLLTFGCPIIKKVWTPSFVLVSCGAATLMLTLVTYLIDVRHPSDANHDDGRHAGWFYKGWSNLCRDYGMNPLFLYIMADIGAILLGFVRIGSRSIGEWAYEGIHSIIPIAPLASLIFAICYVLLLGLLAVWLHRRKIVVKL